MAPENQTPPKGRGFAALGKLAANVSIEDVVIPPAQKMPETAAGEEQKEQVYQAPAPNEPILTPRGWLITGIVVVGLIALASNNNKPAPPAATSRPSSQQLLQPSPPSYTATVQAEVLPPVGTNVTLNEGQIRYCLSENIRLDGAKNLLESKGNNVLQWQIDRFNARIEDFNGRCASYRYFHDVYDRVKAAVELERQSLLSAGARQFESGAVK